MTSPGNHVHIVGLGLIGGSLALALRDQGWSVTGEDLSQSSQDEALERGIITNVKPDPATSLVFVCAPAGSVAHIVQDILDRDFPELTVISDVAGVKESICRAIEDPRFIGGHPMAGSELRGLAGARANLFTGCNWVLTPSEATPADSYAFLHGVLRSLGASVMALGTDEHDRLVALASHVPHVVAGALMNEATSTSVEHGALLRLAAGGFRDMTRISAGDPSIWPDVLFENSAAVLDGLGRVAAQVATFRRVIESRDREELLTLLSKAAVARRQLPGSIGEAESLVEIRIPVDDRPGVLAEVTKLASDLQINIFDIEIAHNVEGSSGVLLLSVDKAAAPALISELTNRAFSVGSEPA